MPRCTTAHPLYTGFTGSFGAPLSETTMRPSPGVTPAAAMQRCQPGAGGSAASGPRTTRAAAWKGGLPGLPVYVSAGGAALSLLAELGVSELPELPVLRPGPCGDAGGAVGAAAKTRGAAAVAGAVAAPTPRPSSSLSLVESSNSPAATPSAGTARATACKGGLPGLGLGAAAAGSGGAPSPPLSLLADSLGRARPR